MHVKQEPGSSSGPNGAGRSRSMRTPESVIDAQSETLSERVQRQRRIRSAARKSSIPPKPGQQLTCRSECLYPNPTSICLWAPSYRG
jgi:hypothetical protein